MRLAAAYSLVHSCRALGTPTREYLIDVIRKLEAGWPARRLAELMPASLGRAPRLAAPDKPGKVACTAVWSAEVADNGLTEAMLALESYCSTAL